MRKSQIPVMPSYYDNYIGNLQDVDLMQALKMGASLVDNQDMSRLYALKDQVYAPGKWTVKDIVQHLVDTERIMSYRALRFARRDETPLSGFEENDYANNANTSGIELESLVAEFEMLRQSTIAMFNNFDDETLLQTGSCNNIQTSVVALGFVIAGHQMHHINVLRSRYFPLLEV
ncbi:MAG: DinB family protein [Saprospiraceae bacterium]